MKLSSRERRARRASVTVRRLRLQPGDILLVRYDWRRANPGPTLEALARCRVGFQVPIIATPYGVDFQTVRPA